MVRISVAAAIAIGAGAWFAYQRFGPDSAKMAQAPATRRVGDACASAAGRACGRTSRRGGRGPGTLKISAVGFSDPSDPRYKGDKTLAEQRTRAPMRKSQIVAKRSVC
jgi:hypothetical protein